MIKTITEETKEVCSLCGGQRTEARGYGSPSEAQLAMTCRQCSGTGTVLTRITRRTEEFNEDEIVEAVARIYKREQDKLP